MAKFGLVAISVKNKVLLTLSSDTPDTYIIERYKMKGGGWEYVETVGVGISDIVDGSVDEGLYQYRAYPASVPSPVSDNEEECSRTSWIRVGNSEPVGYTFKNYYAPEGCWGEVLTADDIRYTYLWGTDFKATNGASFTDAQIEFYIDESVQSIARELNIDITKRRYRTEPIQRGLVKGDDYDAEEALYDYRQSKIERYGFIKTRHRPILDVKSIDLLTSLNKTNLLGKVVIDKTKGVIKLMDRPIQFHMNPTFANIDTAIAPYGRDTLRTHLFYAIDYDAGFENSDEVPKDLRQIIAKKAAISLLNIIGDGLMSGFSSSSLSMDGVSESFSSTQSATSAYFGARIKEYKDDVSDYIKANAKHFGSLNMGFI